MSWLVSNWNARPPLAPFIGRASKKLQKCRLKNNQQYQEIGGPHQLQQQVKITLIFTKILNPHSRNPEHGNASCGKVGLENPVMGYLG